MMQDNRRPSRMGTLLIKSALALCLLAAGGLTGCGGSAARERREELHPAMRKARASLEAGKTDRALEQYRSLLQKEPDLARAHLELGQLYEKEYEDYVSAIYHYRRYLDLRPDTEKRELLDEIIRRARQLLRASIVEPGGDADIVTELRRENEMLRNRLARLSAAADDAQPAPAAATRTAAAQPEEVPVPQPAPAPAEAAIKTYRVRAGDSLTRIAVRHYGEASQWRKIMKANEDQLKRPEDLKPGQTLVIP